MEEDETFDAGKVIDISLKLIEKGAFLNSIGQIELDAIIMEGSKLLVGAVAAVKNVMHPISLARIVMERTEHCLIVGEGAQLLMEREGVPNVPMEDLLCQRELGNILIMLSYSN